MTEVSFRSVQLECARGCLSNIYTIRLKLALFSGKTHHVDRLSVAKISNFKVGYPFCSVILSTILPKIMELNGICQFS